MPNKAGAHVKLSKLNALDDANVVTPDWDQYELGENNPGYSVPTGYFVKGYLARALLPGRPLLVERYERNGERVQGYMETSTVQTVELLSENKIIFATDNSRYCLTFLDEEENEAI